MFKSKQIHKNKHTKVTLTTIQVEQVLAMLTSNQSKVKEMRNLLESKLKSLKERGRKEKVFSIGSLREMEEQAISNRDKLATTQTEGERVFKGILKSLELEYEFQKILWYTKGKGKSFYIVDFYLPYFSIVIEIDGGYHNNDIQVQKDRGRTAILKRDNGIKKVIRFKNIDIISNPQHVINTMKNSIKLEEDCKVVEETKYKKRQRKMG